MGRSAPLEVPRTENRQSSAWAREVGSCAKSREYADVRQERLEAPCSNVLVRRIMKRHRLEDMGIRPRKPRRLGTEPDAHYAAIARGRTLRIAPVTVTRKNSSR